MRRMSLKGSALALLVVLMTATFARADTIASDGDTVAGGNNVDATCVAKTVSSQSVLKYSGGTHFADQTVSVTVTPTTPITVSGVPASLVLSGWDTNNETRSFGFSTSVPANTPTGTYKVTVEVDGLDTDGDEYSVSDFFNVNVTCSTSSTNQTPAVAATNATVTVDEGDTATNSGTWSDADASDTVALSASVGTIVKAGTNAAGTWTWSFDTTDGPDESQTVTITANDGQGGITTTTFVLTVNNVAPAVTAAFAATPVSCGVDNATLDISWTDPGADTHTVEVNWGDGTDPEAFGTQTSGFDAAHTYNAGSYNATVTVTDSDGAVGSDASNAITVNYDTSGILQPVNWTQAKNDPSIFKYGSTIPVKVQFFNCDGSNAGSGLSVRIAVKKIAGSTPVSGTDEGIANTNSPDSGGYMRWSDPLSMYNLNTKSLSDATATYEITLTVVSTGQTVVTQFGTKAK